MAKLSARFDATQHDTTQNKRGSSGDLPTGVVRMQIEASEVKATAAGGEGMKYTAEILEPAEIAGRKFFGYIYLQNPDGTEFKSGTEELASLVRATGVDPSFDDTEHLHFYPYTARLGWSNVQYEKNGSAFRLDGAGNRIVKRESSLEVKEYFFDTDEDGSSLDLPEPALDDPQPAKPLPMAGAVVPNATPANDNAPSERPASRPTASRPAANDNPRPAGSKPWAKKAG